MSLSAFPQIVTEYDDSLHEYTNNVHSVGGMDLRDYFAAKAMQGMLSNGFIPSGGNKLPSQMNYIDLFSSNAYEVADAMMKARGD